MEEMRRTTLFGFLLLQLFLNVPLLRAQTVVTVGSNGADYKQLSLAFADINAGIVKGDIIIKVTDNVIETASALLLESGSGNASYESVLIYPTDTVKITQKNLKYGSLIELRGADHVTIDGRMNQQGTFNALTIINEIYAANTMSLVTFSASAQNNTISYCNMKGSCQGINVGLISFYGVITGNGNNNNVISNCNITSSGYTPASHAIYAHSDSIYDKNNRIEKNRISNIWNMDGETYDVQIEGRSTDWVIADNDFFFTYKANETGSNSCGIIKLTKLKVAPSLGPNGIISNNRMGGSEPNCGGNPWYFSSDDYIVLIDINCGNSKPTILKNNSIRNFNFQTSHEFRGIAIRPFSKVNLIENFIGDTLYYDSLNFKVWNSFIIENTSNDSVGIENNYISSITDNNFFKGIYSKTTNGMVQISNNHIGSRILKNNINIYNGYGIYADNVGNIDGCRIRNNTIQGIKVSDNFTGIYIPAINNTAHITGNIIGDTVGTNSLMAGATTSIISGITCESQDSIRISDNKIGAIEGSGTVFGINCTNAKKTVITNNFIGSKQTPLSITSFYIEHYESRVSGINCIGNAVIEGNTISNISSSIQEINSWKYTLIGIDAMSCTVNRNVVHDLVATNTDTSIFMRALGIRSLNATNNFVYNFRTVNKNHEVEGIFCDLQKGLAFNNIVSLGFGEGNKGGVAGIWAQRAYNNSVVLGGAEVAYADEGSQALFADTAKNNLLVNLRKNGTDKHLLIYATYASDFNHFYFSDQKNGGIGYYNSTFCKTLTDWRIAAKKDYNSFSEDPKLINPGDTIAFSCKPTVGKKGTKNGWVLSDFFGNTRPNPPAIGAIESAATQTQYVTQNRIACNDFTLDGKTYTASGTYQQTIINTNGLITILTLNLIITPLDTSVTNKGGMLTSSLSGATYQWMNCDQHTLIAGAIHQSYIPAVTGNYAVIVTDGSNVCSDTSNCHYLKVTTTDIQQAEYSNHLFVYPNPANDKLLIETAHATIISITNLLGAELTQYEIQQSQTINISNLQPGVYLIKDLKNNITVKFIKL